MAYNKSFSERNSLVPVGWKSFKQNQPITDDKFEELHYTHWQSLFQKLGGWALFGGAIYLLILIIFGIQGWMKDRSDCCLGNPPSFWKKMLKFVKGFVRIAQAISFLTFFLTFGVLNIVINSKVRLGSSKGKTDDASGENETEKGVRTKHEFIPVYSFLPWGLRLPSLIESVILTAKLKREGIKAVDEIYRKYLDHPIFKVPLFLNGHIMVIKCPLLTQKLLGSSNVHVLNKPQYMYRYIFPGDFGNGLLGSEVKVWSPHRKILNHCFTFKALQSYLEIMNRNGKKLVEDLLDYNAKYNSVTTQFLNDTLHRHALNIILEIIMGETILTHEETESFLCVFIKGKPLMTYKMHNPQNIIPIVWWLNPKRKAIDVLLLEIRKYAEKAIQRCKERIQKYRSASIGNEGIRYRSLIEEMICNEASNEEIISEVSTFFFAGHETVVSGMKYFLQHIAEHRKIQVLCQEELDSVFRVRTTPTTSSTESYKHREENFYLTNGDLTSLKCLERCIYETLRITPTIATSIRELSAPMEVNGYYLKKNTILCFPIWAIHRDPNIYPNPEKFDPDRFLPENITQRSLYSFLPFSHGPRNCIGYKVAMMETKVILGMVLNNFDVSTNDNVGNIPIHFDLPTSPEREYRVTLTKR